MAPLGWENSLGILCLMSIFWGFIPCFQLFLGHRKLDHKLRGVLLNRDDLDPPWAIFVGENVAEGAASWFWSFQLRHCWIVQLGVSLSGKVPFLFDLTGAQNLLLRHERFCSTEMRAACQLLGCSPPALGPAGLAWPEEDGGGTTIANTLHLQAQSAGAICQPLPLPCYATSQQPPVTRTLTYEMHALSCR